jgi:cysteine sulfinate desulfinase/cysteine desulfurase-like protein
MYRFDRKRITASNSEDHSVLNPRHTSADSPMSVTKLTNVNRDGFVKSVCRPPFSEYIA